MLYIQGESILTNRIEESRLVRGITQEEQAFKFEDL
jgi:hypothetical protein